MDIVIDSMDAKLPALMNAAREREVVGSVVNIFDKVINVETSHPTALITIAGANVIRAPYMLKITNEKAFEELKRTVNIGDIVRFRKDGVMSLNTDRLIIRSSSLWDCAMHSHPADELEMTNLQYEINHFLKNEGKPGGILNAFLSQSSIINGQPLFLSIYDKYFNRLITQLSQTFTGDNLKKFIGLGVGLTPSGDDFIVGLLAALRSSEAGYHFEKTIKRELTKESIANKTTRVSSHMISYALDGDFNEALLNLLNGRDPLRTSLMQVNSIGSTSGTDMLAGVSFALEHLLKDLKRRE
ncbi:MAG: DUF2877 domain-containing protein [Alkalibacterium sp.]|nr:DUF2877 domain-containing protein [Alkalibacterium sp.]